MMTEVKSSRVTRKEKAAATRKRMLAAAAAEFVANGYHGTPMSAIAARAGVAVQTVYFVFHTKPQLFAAALDAAVLGEEEKPPMEQRWAADAADSSVEPVAALESFIRGAGPIFERAAALSEVASAAAATDPELAEVSSSRETYRVQGYRDFVQSLDLPTGATVDRVSDLLVTLHSPRVYLAFRDGRGWSHESVVEWMATTIPSLVLSRH